MKRLFTRIEGDPEEGTLFGTLDHWVEIKQSTINAMKLTWFCIGAGSMFILLYFIGVYTQ